MSAWAELFCVPKKKLKPIVMTPVASTAMDQPVLRFGRGNDLIRHGCEVLDGPDGLRWLGRCWRWCLREAHATEGAQQDDAQETPQDRVFIRPSPVSREYRVCAGCSWCAATDL